MRRLAALCLCLGLAALLAAVPAAARDPGLLLLEPPLPCGPAATCFIQNYPDQDPGPGARDYACGFLTYDGHTGTDFRPLDPAALRAGVEVLAAAPGVVRAVRNDVDDADARSLPPEALAGREAGNAVALTHPGGWETQYSHLRKGSVRVRPGQQVGVGQVLGLVGLSGRSEFSHVELAVRREGRPVDPFRGLGGGPECGPGAAPLWSPAALARLGYQESALAGAGLTSEIPQPGPALAGQHQAQRLSTVAPAIIFWAAALGVRSGDELAMRLTAPDGAVLAEHRQTLDKTQAQHFAYIGKRRKVAPWPPGTYAGAFTLIRPGADGALPRPVLDITRTVEVR